MNVEMVTLIMIQNDNKEVLVQQRTKKYPGLSYPGGHVEFGESVMDCAIREVKEETNLEVRNLKLCGIVHWSNRESNDRYICFMYTTEEFKGQLLETHPEGVNQWMSIDELRKQDSKNFSSLPEIYGLSPLFYEPNKYSEVFIKTGGNLPIEINYK